MVENFYRRKLVEYLKKNLRKGYPIETLRVALINQHYARSTIDEAIKITLGEMAKEVPVIKEKPQIEHEIIIEGEDENFKPKKSFWKKIVDFFWN